MAKRKDSVRDNSGPSKTPEQDEAAYWLAELEHSWKGGGKGVGQKDWEERCKKLIERYMDDRGEYTERDLVRPQRRMNILWANTEIMAPALFNKAPIPNVTLANKDKNPVGRWAAIALERCIEAELRDDEFMASMQQVVRDLLLPGRGVVWLEYDADVDGDDDDATITRQDIVVRYVHWKDFRCNRGRNWPEVWWVAKRAFLDRQELIDKYGPEIGKKVTLDTKPDEYRLDPITQRQFSKATVWQIYDSKRRKIIEVAPGYKASVLAKRDPVVDFPKFFACPRPLYATLSGDDLIPTPDYVQYQDQAEEIDQLTNRIYWLSKALRLRGFYDQSFAGLSQAFNDANDNELIPVENFALFNEKGGISGAMAWIPLKEVIEALRGAYEARDKAVEVLYQVTGMADIIRGASDPQETAKAQQMKGQFGMLRLRDRQQEIARFARDIIRMMAEIVCQQYTLQTIQEMSGVKLLTQQQKQAVAMWQQLMQQRQMLEQQAQAAAQQAQQAQQAGAPPQPPPQLPPPPPPPVPGMDPEDQVALLEEPAWEEVYGLLKNARQRHFVIDVETDSTIEPDQIAERDAATQFLTATTQYVGAWAQILPAAPELATLCGEMLTFAARKWKIGDTLETKIEEAAKAIEAKAEHSMPPDPKMLAAQLKAQAEGAKTQGTIQTAQIKAGAEQTKAQLGVAQAVAEHHLGAQQIQQERAQSAQEHEQRMREMAIKAQNDAQNAWQRPNGGQGG